MNLLNKLYQHYQANPEKIAYRFILNDKKNQELTYADLYMQSTKVANYFLKNGLKKNERVLIILPQSLNYLVAYFGCLFANVIAIPLYPANKMADFNRIAAIVNDAEVKCVIGDPQTLERLNTFPLTTAFTHEVAQINIEAVLSTANQPFDFLGVADEQIAFLQYTSGSTGDPKGVMVSHGNLKANFKMLQAGMSINEQSKFISWLPLYHDMGLICKALMPVYSNAELTLMTPLRFVKRPSSWLQAISQYRGTHSLAPNFAYEMCIAEANEKELPPLDLSSWCVALNGAEPIRANTIKRFINIYQKYGFNPLAYYPAYGMAEATLYVSGSNVFDGAKFETVDRDKLKYDQIAVAPTKPESAIELVNCGKPWLEEKILTVDPETFATKKPYEIGEIWLMGPHVAQGYWNKPEINQNIFNAHTLEGVGPCLRTGDLGYLNDKGEIIVTGRVKDLIIVRGKNYAPQDLEMTVESCSDLIKPNFALAFSYDNGQQEKLVIAVEIRDAMSMAEQAILTAKIREKISMDHELLPDEILFVARGAIPKTTSGKLQRQACKKLYLSNQLPLKVNNLDTESVSA